jgi:outer membrane protein OmpA-like peptidoglycan-associated protein
VACRWRSEGAALAGAALLALAAAPAPAQNDEGVLDLTLPVQDLTLESARLDDSLSTAESNDRVEVTLAADVLFRFDSASLSRRAQSRITEAAERIAEDDPRVVRVTGYTDSRGSDAYNLGLSRRRAAAVTEALRAELSSGGSGGEAAPRLRTSGRGEADPVAPNTKPDGTDNPRGRARNRRVEVVFPR